MSWGSLKLLWRLRCAIWLTTWARRHVRVNAISAGPVRTLAAAGVTGFKSMYRQFSQLAPLQQNISIEDIGGTAVYLASDLSSKVTGEIIYVDLGTISLHFPSFPANNLCSVAVLTK